MNDPAALRREAERMLRDLRSTLDIGLGEALQMLLRAERIEAEQERERRRGEEGGRG